MINAKTSSKKTLLQIVLFFYKAVRINLLKKCNTFWTDVPKYMDVI